MKNIYKYTTDLKKIFETRLNTNLRIGDQVRVKSPHSEMYLEGEITKYEADVDSNHSGMYLIYIYNWNRSEWFCKEDIDI